MIDLGNCHLFSPVKQPDSDVTFYVLSRKVAPLQKGFYFVNDSMSADGRYLWFCCAYPPALGKTLAVADFESGEVRHFPEAQFSGESPYVDTGTGEVFWCQGASVWRRGPGANDVVECVNTLPSSFIGARGVSNLATHLTRSADGREFFVDANIGLQHVMGSLPVDGGDFEMWHCWNRKYNHAQFSPTNPDVVLFAQENHSDPITGLIFPIVDRMWTIRRGEVPRPVMPEPTRVSHEWWDADGQHVWCVSDNDTWRVRVADGDVERIPFPRHCWHSHNSRDGRLIVGDSNNGFFRGCASTVHFMNRDTGKVIVVAEHAECTDYAGRNYHIDPHPRFVCNDRYVVFTTRVCGEIDLAMVPVEQLIEKTS